MLDIASKVLSIVLRNVILCCRSIVKDANKTDVEVTSTTPADAHTATTTSRTTDSTTGNINWCRCVNGGTCEYVKATGEMRCLCPDNYAGSRCECEWSTVLKFGS